MGVKALQKLQIGAESTKGTEVNATTIWRGPGGMLEDTLVIERVEEFVNIAVPINRTYIPSLSGALSMAATPATFEQLPYILEAGIISETPAQDGAGSDYIYEYPVNTTSINTIRTYTIEGGDNQQAEIMLYSFVTDFSLSGAAGEALMMSANWVGRQIATTTFTAALSVPAVEEILASNGKVYLDAVSGSYGGTQVTAGNVLSFNLDVTTGYRPKWTIDGNSLDFDHDYFDIGSFDISGSLVWEHAATAVTEKSNWRNQTLRLLRLEYQGSAVATPGATYSNKTLLIDVPIYWEKFNALGDQDGNTIVEGTFKGGYDETDATALQITVVNELSALT